MNIRDLSFFYGEKPVLQGLSLDVKAGELCAVMGENGSGKSTLLRLIAGFEQSAAGSLTLSGQDPRRLRPKERARMVAYLPQRFGVYFDTDVLDIVLMGANPELGALGSPSPAHRAQAMEALGFLHIQELAFRNFAELSEGQKQMVMIARCVMQKAPLLLFDEPDSALDINNRRHMMENLSALVHGGERGALLILHDQQLALSFCDKIYFLRDGQIVGLVDRATATVESVQAQMDRAFGHIKVHGIDGEFFMGYKTS